KLSPGEILLIGDTLHDFQVATALGTACVLYSGGHQSTGRLEAAGVPVISSLDEILGCLG
ncbi:MAG: HAD hydrolase-like protein, partial [Planctomycetes bacterium]|nr:HAD hydrolase-like protein [Planctomycetota bacterium]